MVNDMGINMSPENYPVVCDGYVKYEEAEVDRLAINFFYRNNENKRLKIVTFRPFLILFFRNLRKYYTLLNFKMDN